MGSTCSQKKEFCPMHPEEIITHLCMHERCIEPLCAKCLDLHYLQHKEIGASPDIEEIQVVQDKLLKSMKNEASVYSETEQLHSAVREIYPAEYIKEITR
jgi:hypothetical protein